MNFLLLSGGLVLLLLGGDMLVRGAVAISKRLQLPQLLVGMVIVGFGTSAPELVVSVQSAREGADGIAVGNVIGSSIANILLILAIAALVRPIARPERVIFPDGLVLLTITAGVLALGLQPVIPAWQGALMVAILVALIAREYRAARRVTRRLEADVPEIVAEVTDREDEPGLEDISALEAKPVISTREVAEFKEVIETEREIKLRLSLSQAVLGLIGLLIGAELTVRGSVGFATELGISEAIIGLTIVAVGTSVPELASAVVASLRGHSALAYGNIFGSNIFNLLGILGTATMVAPLSFPAGSVLMDGGPLIVATVAMLVTISSGHGLSRFEGALLLCGYVAYILLRTGLVAVA